MPLIDVDRKLLDRCLRKEAGAWHEFVDRYMGLIYHVIQHVSHSRSVPLTTEDVEDYAAEIFLNVVDNDFAVLRRFKGQSSLATYLAVVARRSCVRELVRRQRAAELGHSQAHRAALEEPSSDDLEAVISPDEMERVLHELSGRDADVVRLHLQGLTYRQISKKLNVAENTIGPILSRARKKLRQTLEQRK